MTAPAADVWSLTQAPARLGAEAGDALVDWMEQVVARPAPDLGRRGALCPFVPTSLQGDLIFCAVADPAALPSDAVREAARHFAALEPTPPDPRAINKSVLVLFPAGASGVDLRDAVAEVKVDLIRSGVTCGEFYPDNEDRSVRTDGVRVARSPVPLVAVRYLTPHDRLFLEGRPELFDAFLGRMAQR